jgi:hypothetical protein
MENRNGLVVEPTTGKAELETAPEMIEAQGGRFAPHGGR